jgi:lipooligosaccharide transport system permease protein
MAVGVRGLGASPTLAVLERHLVLHRRSWRGALFSSLVVPVLFVVSIGMGVGEYVGAIDGAGYLAWIVPGVLASTAFQMAVNEATYPVMSDFMWVRAYPSMAATPVTVRDMVRGLLLYLVIRVVISAAMFVAVAAAFGALHSPWAPATLLVCVLVMLSVAAPTAAFSAGIDHDGYFLMLSRFLVIPSTLFAGVLFPAEHLPALIRPLAYASPLWHGVELNRAATLGTATQWPLVAHVGYLMAWAVGGWLLAVRAFGRRLGD